MVDHFFVHTFKFFLLTFNNHLTGCDPKITFLLTSPQPQRWEAIGFVHVGGYGSQRHHRTASDALPSVTYQYKLDTSSTHVPVTFKMDRVYLARFSLVNTVDGACKGASQLLDIYF